MTRSKTSRTAEELLENSECGVAYEDSGQNGTLPGECCGSCRCTTPLGVGNANNLSKGC
jgi:hypothetical protein